MVVLPIKDENPTTRTPFVTFSILVACVGIYFAWQPTLGDQEELRETNFFTMPESLAFNLENAAIPCEIIQGRPLTIHEVERTFQARDGEACNVGDQQSPPLFPDKSVWLALLTSMFLHGGLMHLGGNMLFLWIFGNNVEDHLGPIKFLLFYLIGGFAATFGHVALNLDSTIPLVGASGAIAAVMGAYLVWFPNAPVRTVIIFFLITLINIRAKWLLGFWFVSQFFVSPDAGVAWAAHVGGFVFGVVIGLIVRASSSFRHAVWTPAHRSEMDRRWDTTGGIGVGPQSERRFGGRQW
jgi:membrane associated rhomboid family serine protease